MKTYSVKQIADLLDTNPETVRRWIRDKKLKAVQISRKDGNVIYDDELQRFLKSMPKYLLKYSRNASATALSVRTAALVVGTIAEVVSHYTDSKDKSNIGILPNDFKKYLRNMIDVLNNSIEQKNALIEQTNAEIVEIENQVRQYEYLLEHEKEMRNALLKVTAT